MAIYVNIPQLQEYASKIQSAVENLENAKENIDKAGKAAVDAAGGERTAVGLEIKSAIQDTTNTQYMNAIEVITALKDALSKVSNVYKEENSHLLDRIKAIAANAGGSAQ